MHHPLVLKNVPHVCCFSILCVSFFFFPSRQLGGSPTESELEKLCQAYVEEPNQNGKERLLSFCKRDQSTNLSGLGYFLLGMQEYENDKFEAAERFFSQAFLKPSPIEDYVNYYRASSLYKLNSLEEAQRKLALFLTRFQIGRAHV